MLEILALSADARGPLILLAVSADAEEADEVEEQVLEQVYLHTCVYTRILII